MAPKSDTPRISWAHLRPGEPEAVDVAGIGGLLGGRTAAELAVPIVGPLVGRTAVAPEVPTEGRPMRTKVVETTRTPSPEAVVCPAAMYRNESALFAARRPLNEISCGSSSRWMANA